MKVCAIDVHHHYVPTSLLEEAKKNGKHLGVELAEKDGNNRSPLPAVRPLSSIPNCRRSTRD